MVNLKIPKPYNHIIDYDSIHLYPGTISSLNTIMNKYYVLNEFPFEVIHREELCKSFFTLNLEAPKKPFESYDRRLDAEMHRLILLEQYYKEVGDVKQAGIIVKQLQDIKEDHPEWLI